MVSERDDLVNPYENATRRRFTASGATLRRRLILLVVLVATVALVVGTVGTSCGPPPIGTQDVTGAPAG